MRTQIIPPFTGNPAITTTLSVPKMNFTQSVNIYTTIRLDGMKMRKTQTPLDKHYISNVQLRYMNIITTTVLRNNLADTLKEVSGKKDYFLVAKKGLITSALVNIDLFEDLIALVNKSYVDSIKKAREEYEKGDVFTHEEAFGSI